MKRPKIITILAVVIIVSVPFDLFTVVNLRESAHQDIVNNHEALIKNGKIIYHGKIVYWDKQSDFAKNRIINQLNNQKKILANFFFYKTFKWLFVGLSALLFYGLWNLKRWALVIFVATLVLGVLFNIMFVFFSFKQLFLFLMLDMILLGLAFMWYKKYFITI